MAIRTPSSVIGIGPMFVRTLPDRTKNTLSSPQNTNNARNTRIDLNSCFTPMPDIATIIPVNSAATSNCQKERMANAENMTANALTIFTRGSSRSIKLRFSWTSPFACPEPSVCRFVEPAVSEVTLVPISRVTSLPFCLRSSAITRSASTSISVCEWEMMSMVMPCAWRVWMRLCTRVVAASSSPAVGSSIIRICGWHVRYAAASWLD